MERRQVSLHSPAIGAPGDVPSTYVPARNTVLLSLALAWAETLTHVAERGVLQIG